MELPYDPLNVDAQTLSDNSQNFEQLRLEEEERLKLREQQSSQVLADEEKAKAEREDPRLAEGGGGFKGAVKEVQSAIGGGLQDTASSIVTLPERAIDMFSGEMVEEGKTEEGYGAEWDDWFVDDANPIETKTWWGSAIRSLVHFGSMAAAIIPAAKVAGVTAASTLAGSLVRGAGIGAASDLASKYSQEDNGLQILRDRFGFLDTPITTNDADHPAMKTLKNVVEGIGIGAVFDGASIVLGKGIRKIRTGKKGEVIVEDGVSDAIAKAEARGNSVDEQVLEKAKIEAQEKPGKFGAYKNKPIADPWQSAPTSNGKAYDVRDQLSRTRKEWGAEIGSTDSLTTPVQLNRTALTSGMAEEHIKAVLKDFMSDTRIQVEIADAKASGKTLADVWGESAESMKRVFEGRNTSDISPEEFWSEFNLTKDTIDDQDVWKSKNVVAGDLIIGSLVREMRDLGTAGREIWDIADVADIEGPAKAMYDKIITGLTQIKLAKMTKSADFRNLGAGKVREVVDSQVAESIDAFRLAMKVAGNSKDDNLFKAIFETISMSNDIHNLTDFDAWVRKKLKGGDFNGQPKTGVLVKELQGVMVNSVLSGPKTSARAIMGTSTATFLRPISQTLGAALTLDGQTMRASLASLNAMREAIPEAWQLFKTNLNAYWSGDVATVKSRFSEYTKGDQQWDLFRHWIEESGEANLGDKAAFYMANIARSMNDNKFLTYSTKIMGATDDAFGYILARARAKELAMRDAMGALNKGNTTVIDPALLKQAEDRFLGQIMDADGNITDAATLYAKKEATLTTDLSGFAKGLNTVFEANPWAKPFFLFARTGVNGLQLTAKHTPVFNFLVKEWNDIAFASAENLQPVMKYGINTAEDLANAKALQRGRLAIGAGLITMANQHFMSGGLTGNGPADRRKRQVWIDSGWKPRSIRLGDVWVSYDSFEPFNVLLSTIADVGDNSQLMGPEWAETNFLKLALLTAQGVTSKSYLAGLTQFADLFSGQPGQAQRIIAGLANNTIPLSSLRNEIGKLFNPHMKELSSGIGDAIRNRNLLTEGLAIHELPTKYDMLTGKPIKDWDFPTRMFNMFSPFNISLDQGPGRQLLFDSGYDMRMSTYSSPTGIDLSDSPRIRSMFQKAIGDQNLEYKLNRLAKSEKVLNSLAEMQADQQAGRYEIDPMKAYYHNKRIAQIFDEARKIAWQRVQNDPDIRKLIDEKMRRDQQNITKLNKTKRYQQVLNY